MKTRYLEIVPHAKKLGMIMERYEPGTGECTIRQPFREELIGDPVRRVVHGGVITTLLDTLGGSCVAARGGVMPQATLDLRIDYLRPAVFGLDLIADGLCHHTTRHVAFVRGVCHQGDPQKPIASMTATFMLADRPDLVAGAKR